MQIPPPSQTCSRCRIEKSVEDFSPSNRGKKGSWCRSCFAEYNAGNRSRSAAPPSRECDHCGVEYQPKQAKGKFCSPACKANANYWRRNPKQQRNCAECGIDISDRRADVVYCSNLCAVRAKAKRPGYSDMRRAGHLKHNYGLTPADYSAMLASQGGGCAICKSLTSRSKKPRFAVDHDHISSAVRGLLCSPCNLAVGHLQDDPALMEAAAAYVRLHRSTPT